MKYQIYLKGVDQLERETGYIMRELNRGKANLLLKQARIVRTAIRRAAPRGPTGNLRRGAYAAVIRSSKPVAFAGIRPRRAPHAHLVEFGHGGPHPAPPHPFVAPTWDSLRGQVRENIRLGLKGVVDGT